MSQRVNLEDPAGDSIGEEEPWLGDKWATLSIMDCSVRAWMQFYLPTSMSKVTSKQEVGGTMGVSTRLG